MKKDKHPRHFFVICYNKKEKRGEKWKKKKHKII